MHFTQNKPVPDHQRKKLRFNIVVRFDVHGSVRVLRNFPYAGYLRKQTPQKIVAVLS